EKKTDPAKPAPAKTEEPKKEAPKPEAPKSESPKDEKAAPKEKPLAKDAQVLMFKVKDIDGKEVDLAQYKGKVVLIVNVASHCGFTPQYRGLEKLYRDNKDKGFVVLGFPSSDFNQEL